MTQNRLISNLQALFDIYEVDTIAGLERRVYKDTDCGAWVQVSENRNQFRVGSIVEGWDGETPDGLWLTFPFMEARLDRQIERVNETASLIWDIWNTDDNEDPLRNDDLIEQIADLLIEFNQNEAGDDDSLELPSEVYFAQYGKYPPGTCPYCGARDSLIPAYHEITRERFPDMDECSACHEDVKVDDKGLPTEDQE